MKTIKTLTFLATAFLLSLFLQTSTVQAAGKPQVVINFTKWVTAFPLMEGVSDIGDFEGEVLNLTQIAGGQIWKIDALYHIIAGEQSFTALIHGKHSWQTGLGVLNGVITDAADSGLLGANVHVEFEAIPSAEHGFVFTGTITIMPN
jgi:hypothetical protein